jgi:signal transduction histidine kinase/ActR/RegA family two-component response regulator/putative methionine-R-sulfoxide reductase with GAF domain
VVDQNPGGSGFSGRAEHERDLDPADEQPVRAVAGLREPIRILDAREQVAASRDILDALRRAGANPEEVLDVIVERARQLCLAQVGQLYLRDGEVFRISRFAGPIPDDFRTYVTEHPIALDRSSSVGRSAVERSTDTIDDVLADPEYNRMDLQRIGGFRSLLSTPLILEDEVVGALSMYHPTVAHFDTHDQRLLEEFAVQAAIVLRQVQLMQALELRRSELATKVAQLEALREVGETVSSSLDLDEVLDQIVSNAVRLTGTDGGSIMEFDEAAQAFHVRTAYGSSDAMLAQLRAVTISRDSTLVGRTALDRTPLVVPDLSSVTLDPHLEILFRNGWRSVLAAPMLRGDLLVGVIVIRRRRPGTFSSDTVELLETLASQSALAILNARLFRELEAKTGELEVASRHKSEFLASMSHELRTPLNAVIGFSEVLLDRMFGDLNERQEDYLHDIRSSGRHLLELLNEILDLSKVEAGQMVLEPSMFSVAAALEYGLALVRERAAAHGIRLDLEVGEGVGVIEADELKFKQVLLNLLSNAVKFTPDGGTVTLAATRSADGLTVTVTDTGIGVPLEDRERIFESFQQGGRGAPKEEGTGLGLTLSRRIVELFGGRLWLEPGPDGRGSVFGFTVPAPHDVVPGSGPANGAAILIVDDDRASLDLMSAYLSGFANRVLRARDGVDALRQCRQVHPTAVVLDIRLPKKDGWSVLSELKADPETSSIPVIVASIVDERARGLALGASDYLLKPVRRDQLVESLRRVDALAAAELGPSAP